MYGVPVSYEAIRREWTRQEGKRGLIFSREKKAWDEPSWGRGNYDFKWAPDSIFEKPKTGQEVGWTYLDMEYLWG